MRSTCFLGLVLLLLIGSPSIGAQENPPTDAPRDSAHCVDPDFLSNALIECGADLLRSPEAASEVDISNALAGEMIASAPASEAEDIVFPPYCRMKVDAVFWGGRQWLELAEALANDHSQCAEHWVTIPPRDADMTTLRPGERFDEVRVLNARIHPVAEIRWTSRTGWRAWVVGGHPRWAPGRTFYGAGVEARRRMEERLLDVTRGETWALNELTEDVLENDPGARAEILEFVRGLYDGAPGMPKARGIVFNIGPFSDAMRSDAEEYKASLKAWLADGPFWRELDKYVDFFAHEVYVSSLNWGVAAAPLARRAEYLNDYLHHMTALAEDGPAAAEAARDVLRRTYVPLANALWPHPRVGHTDLLSAEMMSHFLSTQVYAVRHYANSHPRSGPRGRIGFGWAPLAELPGYTTDGRNLIRTRLASAIHESSEKGTNSQMGACGPPGEHVWCGGEVHGATFTEVWKIFATWD